MVRHDITILLQLGNDTVGLYHPCTLRVEDMTREDYLHYLIVPLVNRWKLPYTSFPDEECFYRAFRKLQPGNAFCEKLALLYFAHKLGMSLTEMHGHYRPLIGRKQMGGRTYWEGYKREYEAKKKQPQKRTEKIDLRAFANELEPKDKKMLFEILKNEIAKTGKRIRKGVRERKRERV